MTTLTTQRRRGRARGAEDCDRPSASTRTAEQLNTLFTDLGGEPTLDEFIAGAWEGLATHDRIACPICGGQMTAVYGAHARPAAGRCEDCGTSLS
jgi:hypothetical protein